MIVAVFLVGLFVLLGYGATALFGPAMAPPPPRIAEALLALALKGDLFADSAQTLFRGAAGLLIANLVGVGAGIAAGLSPLATRLIRPLVSALNACPPVVWIAFAMIWMGAGGGVPTLAVAAATLPPVFLGTLEGVLAISPRLWAMSRAFAVPAPTRLLRMVLPGIAPFWLAALAQTSSAAWKVAAVAEYLGSTDGIGARIYWAYRRLDMADLYAWTLVVMALGVLIESGLIARLRRQKRPTRAREAR